MPSMWHNRDGLIDAFWCFDLAISCRVARLSRDNLATTQKSRAEILSYRFVWMPSFSRRRYSVERWIPSTLAALPTFPLHSRRTRTASSSDSPLPTGLPFGVVGDVGVLEVIIDVAPAATLSFAATVSRPPLVSGGKSSTVSRMPEELSVARSSAF